MNYLLDIYKSKIKIEFKNLFFLFFFKKKRIIINYNKNV